MMSSEWTNATQAYVWVSLPGEAEPVVAGRIVKEGGRHLFTYGRSYRERVSAIPLSPFELPLEAGTFEPAGLNRIHSVLRDGAPDAWGRRVVGYRFPSLAADELDYMLLSGSDRIGALDFQVSATEYQPRELDHPTLDLLLEAAERVERGQALPPELDHALLHGTSVGGARPKALIDHDGRGYIAKFSSSGDSYDVVKAEYVAMRLAALAGVEVAPVALHRSLGRDVLLVERFDRWRNKGGEECRRMMLSGLSLLGLDEMEARYASYLDLADRLRQRFVEPTAQLRELYRRLIFNVLIGNTDDHARNHAAFWDGRSLRLTPAYDLCPQGRTGREASQAMDVGGVNGRLSTLRNVHSVSGRFRLDDEVARELVEELISSVETHWQAVCDEAELSPVERGRLWRGAVLNPFCFTRWESAG